MGIKENLNALMAQSGDNPHSLAAKVRARYGTGPTQPTLARIADGTSMEPRRSSLKPVADFYGVTVDQLFQGDITKLRSGASVPAPSEPGPEFVAVRRARLKLQAGASGYAIEYLNGDSLPIFFRADWFAQKGCKPDRCVALRVAGQSMEPNMFDGDIVIIDLDATRPIDGVPFAANYEGEAVIKRLRRDAGEWWLSSDNPDKSRYRDKKCTEDVTIIGQVIYRQTEHV